MTKELTPKKMVEKLLQKTGLSKKRTDYRAQYPILKRVDSKLYKVDKRRKYIRKQLGLEPYQQRVRLEAIAKGIKGGRPRKQV